MPRLNQEGVHRVLDLGCGIGRHVVLMAASGFETHGLDISEYAIEHCNKWLDAEGLEATVSHCQMDALPYQDGFFDFVISWNVIYHTTRKKMTEIIAETGRVLRYNGLLYLTLNSTRNSHFGIGSGIEPGTFDNPEKIDGQHLHHYSDEDDVRDLLLNWQIETMKESEQGLTGEPFPGSWHWIVLARNSRTSTYDERIHVYRQDAQGCGASPNRF